jgi:Uma2 family endonuclease
MTYATGHSIPQSSPPRPPRETLPTMYDLPSEWPEEPGLPDEFHDLQPQLLSRTLALADYSRDHWFAASDLNLYYDVHHPLWHKRPDWFLAVGVPSLYEQRELRLQLCHLARRASPPGDCGVSFPWDRKRRPGSVLHAVSDRQFPQTICPVSRNRLRINRPVTSLPSMSTSLRVPHYITYDRRTQQLRYFQLVAGQYQEQPLAPHAPADLASRLAGGAGHLVG